MDSCWVSSDNKEIIALECEFLKNPAKKYRLEDWDKANVRLTEMNRKFNDPENKGLK